MINTATRTTTRRLLVSRPRAVFRRTHSSLPSAVDTEPPLPVQHPSAWQHFWRWPMATATAVMDQSNTTIMMDPIHWSSYEMQRLMDDIRGEMVTTNHPVLEKAAAVIFGTSSTQRIRPMTVFLMARALADHYEHCRLQQQQREEQREVQVSTTTKQSASTSFRPQSATNSSMTAPQDLLANVPKADKIRQLANITEVYHISMVMLHQSVIDEFPQSITMASSQQPPEASSSSSSKKIPFGSKVAILAGDFLLAKSLVKKASLGCAKTVEALSTGLEHMTLGQACRIRQREQQNGDSHWERHMLQMHHQTASLMALSCQSVAFLLSSASDDDDDHHLKDTPRGSDDMETSSRLAYAYGKHLGLAFQLMQEARDFQQHPTRAVEDCVGAGIFTAPLAWAADSSRDDDDDFLVAVQETNAVALVQEQAIQHAERAVAIAQGLAPSAGRDALVALARQAVDGA